MSAIDTYFNNLEALLAKVRNTQAEAMEEAARRIADSLKAGGSFLPGRRDGAGLPDHG